MNKEIYRQLRDNIAQGRKCNLIASMQVESDGRVRHMKQSVLPEGEEGFVRVPTLVERDNGVIWREPVVRRERLLLFGGGHISKYVCMFAAQVGFSVWLAEEREEFASRERFPDADKIICAPYEEALEQMQIGEQDFVAIVTRGHSCDGDCLFYVLTHTMPRYLGMIGSRRRVQAQFAWFMERGIPKEKLDKVHNPIGIDIKAATPEEIAISIVAELIKERRSSEETGAILTDLDSDMIGKIADCARPAALATIVRTRGSCPRKEGSKMLVFADGSIEGTVGGGLGERKAIDLGMSLIGTGEARILHLVMDTNVAERVGMACGGVVDMLVEDLTEGQV